MYSATPDNLSPTDLSGVFACDNDEKNIASSYAHYKPLKKLLQGKFILKRRNPSTIRAEGVFLSLSDPEATIRKG